jgi:Leucine-rich repeat (LRR) protein
MYLYCEYNQLTQLSRLPQGLKRLNCNNNQLTQLPQLPQSLMYLYCSNNKLIRLPLLPQSLISLYCDNNQLTQISLLPKKLISLRCGGIIPDIGNIDPRTRLKLYIKHHNAIIKFQRIGKSYLWRRNASLKERCRQIILVYYSLYDSKKINKLEIPQELIDYLT